MTNIWRAIISTRVWGLLVSLIHCMRIGRKWPSRKLRMYRRLKMPIYKKNVVHIVCVRQCTEGVASWKRWLGAHTCISSHINSERCLLAGLPADSVTRACVRACVHCHDVESMMHICTLHAQTTALPSAKRCPMHRSLSLRLYESSWLTLCTSRLTLAYAILR